MSLIPVILNEWMSTVSFQICPKYQVLLIIIFIPQQAKVYFI